MAEQTIADLAKQFDFKTELQKLTIGGLKELGDWIEGAKDFAVQEMPKFVQEYVTWFMANAVINTMMCLFIAAVAVFFAWWGSNRLYEVHDRREKDSRCYDDEWWWFASLVRVGLLCVAFGFSIGAIYTTKNIAKALVAPRLVVVDGIKSIIQTETRNSCER